MSSSSRNQESTIVAAPVWDLIRSLEFKWWTQVTTAKVEGTAAEVGSLRTVTFKDGTVQKFKVLELSDLDHFITYEVIESNPSAQYFSAVHTLRLRKVTTPKEQTFVEWSSEFATENSTANVVEDSKFKKREAFEDLVKHI
ncbi:hypothetical protein HK099_005496 [Clydaea vesicula]|uniref:Bet v1-like protein n=1 Tax=Clydaea vesicula TaxID=447962 RepID=A0AAD5XYN5_9FUNG|nr:hypothetical protein HK099_005496 [Clydaea vesicula]KAJ3396220.1 hypothetical protein HDU92_003678 [Lobulomyces angularis]